MACYSLDRHFDRYSGLKHSFGDIKYRIIPYMHELNCLKLNVLKMSVDPDLLAMFADCSSQITSKKMLQNASTRCIEHI